MELDSEGIRRDLAILTTEVSNLTRRRVGRVTSRVLTTDEGIEATRTRELATTTSGKDMTRLWIFLKYSG